jgi:mRNA interferase HicA
MKGAEFIRKVRKTGRKTNAPVRFVTHRGKGSHGTLYYGDRHTVVKDRKKEIGAGLLASMLNNLGLTKNEM